MRCLGLKALKSVEGYKCKSIGIHLHQKRKTNRSNLITTMQLHQVYSSYYSFGCIFAASSSQLPASSLLLLPTPHHYSFITVYSRSVINHKQPISPLWSLSLSQHTTFFSMPQHGNTQESKKKIFILGWSLLASEL